MSSEIFRRFDVTPAEARAMQCELRRKVRAVDEIERLERIAGLDVGLDRTRTMARAAVVVLSYPSLQLLEQAMVLAPIAFPYLPGLLSFREAPPLLAALEHLRDPPDVLMCDGHGLAHPRRFGLACHLGVATGLPTIGVAKSRLVGHYREPAQRKGSRSTLLDGEERIGTVLRTRDGIRPVFVSVGHRVSLERAEAITLACCTRYRLPQPARLADRLASARAARRISARRSDAV